MNLELQNVENKSLIDPEDFEKVSGYRWFAIKKRGYVVAKKNSKRIWLHRLIMNPPQGLVVDHINGNPLDNRKSNLKICSIRENNKNEVI